MVTTDSAPRPRKRYGQHFLHDSAIIARIVRAIDPRPGQCIVEIGPGRGALTLPLLQAVGELDVLEIDRDLAALLKQRFETASDRLRVHCVDALRCRFDTLATPGRPIIVVGNLPYNISTPLLFHMLEQIEHVACMVFMLQREVAERIAASRGGRQYGRLSVMVQYHCRVEPLFHVGPGAFTPPPKVDSTVIRLTPLRRDATERAVSATQFARVVARAFSSRRKTLRNALKGWLSEEDFRTLAINPQQRPETLTVEQFVSIANHNALGREDVM